MKYMRLPLVLFVILFVTILGLTTANADSEWDKRAKPTEEENIQEVINKYFEIRY